ncbi:hypothetical protein DER46DRAFT_668474 [Fusarium sp. MPI-SDFR-AT-0072]|nr:hypothetical protein DER46DRAFT_668474 [Fusarium sp. MPI-SDFR-AT-0072]
MHHGMGTNGRMMSMLLGVPLHEAGSELVAIDMPGYGCTVPRKGHVWDYEEGIVGMCFMDMRIQIVADAACRNLFMSRIGAPMRRVMHALGLGWMSMPMYITGRMSTFVNNPQALAACIHDNSSANAWPVEDRWTPLWVSEAFLRDVEKVKVKTVMLDGAGHYPLEHPGLGQMVEAIVAFLKDIEQEA